MSHDELLDRIAQEGLKPDGNVLNTRLVLSLRAVVELHKEKLDDVGRPVCSGCMTGSSWRIYPCPTIQAIEKELA